MNAAAIDPRSICLRLDNSLRPAVHVRVRSTLFASVGSIVVLYSPTSSPDRYTDDELTEKRADDSSLATAK